MSYIDNQMLVDEVADDVSENDDLTHYFNAVDRNIEIQCAKNRVRIDELPLDVDGYLTSRILIEYGILEFKHRLFLGYAESSDGSGEDSYSVKLKLIDKDYRDIKKQITRESILGLFTEDGEPKGKMSVVSQMPMSGGAPSGGCYR